MELNDPVALLKFWVSEGWKYRGIDKMPLAERRRYKAQVAHELKTIIGKDFTDYFLVMSDLIRYCKDHGVPVGPGRGSSAGSLVCFLLRITEVDPMLFPGMSFERFLDPNRSDDPDIDTDFDDDFRDLVRQRAVEKYGADRVGNIGTFTRYKAKNSLDDVARVYDLPRFDVAMVKEMVLERPAGDADTGHDLADTVRTFPQVAKMFEKYPQLWKATELEGNLKNFSVHAAGIVIGAEPLDESVAMYAREDAKTKQIRKVLSVDKFDGEYVGLMKLDALGLSTMGMIRIALDLVGMTLEELYKVPLTDAGTLQLFHDGDITGIFQFEGGAMRTTTVQLKPKVFMDLAAINALARPGPLHSGSTGDYIQIRHGRMERKDPHPIFSEITKDTEGQLIYQEQIVAVVREIGNFDWAMATKVRKAVAKSQGEAAFRPYWEAFAEGAAMHGIGEKTAREIWDRIVTAGQYAFNMAHSVSYSMLGFWCAWLKYNHPLEFYTAQLRKLDPNTPTGKERIKMLLRDVEAHGYRVYPVELNRSGLDWEPAVRGVRAGFTQIKGIGPKQAEAIIELRDTLGEFDDWNQLLRAKGIGPAKIKEILAFAESDDPFGTAFLGRATARLRKAIRAGDYGYVPWPDTMAADIPYEAVTSFHKVLIVVNNRISKNIYENHRRKTGEELDPATVRDPELSDYVTLHCEDVTGQVTVSVNRYVFDKHRAMLENLRLGRDFLLVEAKKIDAYGTVLLAQELYLLDPDKGEK